MENKKINWNGLNPIASITSMALDFLLAQCYFTIKKYIFIGKVFGKVVKRQILELTFDLIYNVGFTSFQRKNDFILLSQLNIKYVFNNSQMYNILCVLL